jgi:hypothetical protein
MHACMPQSESRSSHGMQRTNIGRATATTCGTARRWSFPSSMCSYSYLCAPASQSPASRASAGRELARGWRRSWTEPTTRRRSARRAVVAGELGNALRACVRSPPSQLMKFPVCHALATSQRELSAATSSSSAALAAGRTARARCVSGTTVPAGSIFFIPACSSCYK